jgi:hypothetical protein
MPDTTIKKVEAGFSPRGEMGQKYLVAGKRVSMRLWMDEPGPDAPVLVKPVFRHILEDAIAAATKH